MGRKQQAINNSFIGVITTVVTMLIQFVTRTVFVKYLGIELLGVSSTFTSVLGMLSLADLGFQSAIIFHLYKPLLEQDYDAVNGYVDVLRIVFNIIGAFFIIIGFCVIPALPKILSGINVTNEIRIIFLIQAANSACTYFWGYRRTLLFADRREYVAKITDAVINIIFSVIKIIIVIKTADYIIYILLAAIQTIVSNLSLHMMCKKQYSFLCKKRFDKAKFQKLWSDIKNVFIGKLAGYIYGCTDNIIISSVIGTIVVGFVVNYTTVINAVNAIVLSIFSPIAPIIGNFIVEEPDEERVEGVFRAYTYIRYSVALCALIPMIVLMNPFIEVWLGREYLLSAWIVWLYGIDKFIGYVHSGLCDYINAKGLFKESRNVEIAGAVSNLILSIILAYVMGVEGVLIGTVISGMVFWIGRGRIVYKYIFGSVKDGFRKYWQTMAVYTVIFIISTWMMNVVYSYLNIKCFFLRFVVGGILCEIAAVGLNCFIFGRTAEFRGMAGLIKENLWIKH